MKKKVLASAVSAALLCLCVFVLISYPAGYGKEEADQGVLDLSEADFNRHIMPLSGEWEFYFEALYVPEDFEHDLDREPDYQNIPGDWEQAGKYPLQGYGTYRMIFLIEKNQEVDIYLPEINAASRCWINGTLIAENGVVGIDKSSSKFGTGNHRRSFISAESGINEIIVQAANYWTVESGLYYLPVIGTENNIRTGIYLPRVLAAFVAGILFMAGVYHLILFLFRRQNQTYLIFSILAVTASIRIVLENNGLVHWMLPHGTGVFYLRTFLLLYVVHALFIFWFNFKVFQLRLRRWTKVLLGMCFTVPIAANLLLPIYIGFYFNFVVFVPIVTTIILIPRSQIFRENPFHIFYYCALFVYLLVGGILKPMFDSVWFAPAVASNLFMMLAQCFMLAYQYTEAFRKMESTNVRLEEMVEERTGELKEAYEKLAGSQAILKEMIENVSHDLKTPLTVLSLNLELLNEEEVDLSDEEKRTYLEVAYQKNSALQRIVRSLFEITRMEAGKLSCHLEETSSEFLVSYIEQEYGSDLKVRGLTLESKGDHCTYFIDFERMWVVLDNIIYNSIRYTETGGLIKVEFGLIDDVRSFLRISDTGCGISEEHLPHVFKRFYKADQARGKDSGDSGLGLYIVESNVKAMNGSVSIESQPGLGTAVTMIFPSKAAPSYLNR